MNVPAVVNMMKQLYQQKIKFIPTCSRLSACSLYNGITTDTYHSAL